MALTTTGKLLVGVGVAATGLVGVGVASHYSAKAAAAAATGFQLVPGTMAPVSLATLTAILGLTPAKGVPLMRSYVVPPGGTMGNASSSNGSVALASVSVGKVTISGGIIPGEANVSVGWTDAAGRTQTSMIPVLVT